MRNGDSFFSIPTIPKWETLNLGETMPISYTIDRMKDMTVLNLSGEVSLDEFIQTLQAYINDNPTTYEIYDARELNGTRFSTDEVKHLAKFLQNRHAKRVPGSKTAIVVDRDIDFGLSRMISMMTDQTMPYRIEVFRSMEAAKKWLDR